MFYIREILYRFQSFEVTLAMRATRTPAANLYPITYAKILCFLREPLSAISIFLAEWGIGVGDRQRFLAPVRPHQ